jgi:hypothetical protein
MKSEAQRLDLRPVNIGQSHHWRVTAPAKLNSQSNQRIDVAKGANIREDDAHSEIRSPE